MDSRAGLSGHTGSLLAEPPGTLPGLRQRRQGHLWGGRSQFRLPLPHCGSIRWALGSAVWTAPPLLWRHSGLPVLLCPGNYGCWAVGSAPGSASTGQPEVCGPQALRPSLAGRRGDCHGSEYSLGSGSSPHPRLLGREVLLKDLWQPLPQQRWEALDAKQQGHSVHTGAEVWEIGLQRLWGEVFVSHGTHGHLKVWTLLQARQRRTVWSWGEPPTGSPDGGQWAIRLHKTR